jgi:hypothetical protein
MDVLAIDLQILKNMNVFHFRSLVIQLRMNEWRTFVQSNNPLAAALLCKARFRDEERLQVRLEFLRMITRLQIDPARMRLIGVFFDTYLRLQEREEEQVRNRLHEEYFEEEAKVMGIMTFWERNTLVKALEQGLEHRIYLPSIIGGLFF